MHAEVGQQKTIENSVSVCATRIVLRKSVPAHVGVNEVSKVVTTLKFNLLVLGQYK